MTRHIYQFIKVEEKFEDKKGVIKNRKSKDRQPNGQKKKDKQRSTKHYTKLNVKIEQHELH